MFVSLKLTPPLAIVYTLVNVNVVSLANVCASDSTILFWFVTEAIVTVPEIPEPVTVIPATRVPELPSSTSAVVLVVAPFTFAVACVSLNVSAATGLVLMLAMLRLVPV